MRLFDRGVAGRDPMAQQRRAARAIEPQFAKKKSATLRRSYGVACGLSAQRGARASEN
jgi:hypothetical protein